MPVAVTYGPGLLGSLLIGLTVAKGIAYSLEIPVIGINHLEAHLYANFLLYPEVAPPLLGLIISGGHTELVYLSKKGKYKVLGTTRDDAAGEAFDKVARILNLGYPRGPANLFLRSFLKKEKPNNIEIFFPSAELCTDNAAMVAACAYAKLKRGETSSLSLDAQPNLSF